MGIFFPGGWGRLVQKRFDFKVDCLAWIFFSRKYFAFMCFGGVFMEANVNIVVGCEGVTEEPDIKYDDYWRNTN